MGLDSAHRIARVPLDGSSQKRKRHGVTAPETVGGCAHFANDALQLTHQLHEKHNQQRDTDQPAVMRMERYFATQSDDQMLEVDLGAELYECLSCTYTGIREDRDGSDHFMAHAILTNHHIALLVRKQQLYCACCRDFIYPGVLLDMKSTTSAANGLSIQVHTARSWRKHIRKNYPPATPRRPSRRGLVNMGNTCYMNAVLQAFAHNPLLQHYFFIAKSHGTIICQQQRKQQVPPPVCLGCELGEFMATMSPAAAAAAGSSSSASPLIPHKLLESFWSFAPSFIGSQQHDAHEFFLEFLGGLHSHTHPRVFVPGGVSPRFTPKGKSLCDCVVHQHFAGVLQSQVECVICDTVSATFDPFLDLSLSLEGLDDDDDDEDQPLSLDTLLAKFTADEHLRGINRVYCRRCNAYANMVKRLRIHTLPNVLVIHIKRLDFHKQQKLSSFVQFPAKQLNLAEFRSSSAPGDADDPVTPRGVDANDLVTHDAEASLYDLAAVINHHGDSVEGGHYTAFIQSGEESDNGDDGRDANPQQWLLFDDTQVSPVPEDQMLNSQAYVWRVSMHQRRALLVSI